MKRLLLLSSLLFATAAEAQSPRRVPLTGYVDRSGNVVEPATWEAGSPLFQGDWVAIWRGGKAGYLNLRTRATTGLRFDGVADASYDRALFSHGPEPVLVGDKWGYADETGRIVIAPGFAGAGSYDADGLAIVQIRNPSGFGLSSGMIDRNGRIVVEPRYDIIRPFRGASLTGVSRAGRFGAIDRTGKEVIPLRFGGIGAFAVNGLAPATISGGYNYNSSGRWGYVDRTGRFVIPERFSYAGNFTGDRADGGLDAPAGLARVGLGSGEIAYIDATGRVVTRFAPGVNAWGVSANGLVRFQDQGTARYGFADAKTGAIVIPARFSQVGGFDQHGLAAAKEGDQAGFIRVDGQWAFPPRFSSASDFDTRGHAQVVENDRSELIDRNGNVVATLTHGERFFYQGSDFAAFRVFPGREDAPTQRFGGWSLDTTLYAVPETPSLMPTPLGSIRLGFATDDGLVRWRIETEGWEVRVVNEEGPAVEPDITRQNRLTDLPKDVDALIALFARQTEGRPEFSIATTLPGATAQATQAERAGRIAANRTRYLAQLHASSPDLRHALAAMRSRIADQFGKLSGTPCMPPQCVY
ncbi:WG repeat-containing protein [Sphingomonas sp. JC676]|uniref:WG repeat-containing protein n=1 Tax=Sphingomonas sp. JC676 TaxID=2768065 RepID=UPI001658402A|nr:WG repeat-containing protein [Sphingomonas sp. JC676]MBC9034319.1 WG repeat-containing protein [Sphingomonas sp. JC676]